MCVDCLCGCDDSSSVASVFVTDIVHDRAGEQEVILRHDAHLRGGFSMEIFCTS